MLDLRYALRTLARARGFALAVALTLGLGIGANTAIFSVARAVMRRPLPHRDGDRLMYLHQSAQGAGRENVNFSVPEINDFRTASKTLGGIAEYHAPDSASPTASSSLSAFTDVANPGRSR